jgi:L-amino acid N-acyltransferase YncA
MQMDLPGPLLKLNRRPGSTGTAGICPRRYYAGVVEVSIYVASAFRGHGIGRVLLVALIVESERLGT